MDPVRHRRIQSWLELMRNIEFYLFAETIRYIVNIAGLGTFQTHERKVLMLDQLAKKLDALSALCEGSELAMTHKAIAPLRETVALQMTGAPINFDSIQRGANVVASRLEDELSLRLFFEVDSRQAEQFKAPLMHWEQIIERFPALRQNIEESSKCFALERYGAAVFHILLVAEYGVIALAKLIKVEGDKPGWGALERLQKILKVSYKDRSDFEKQHSQLLEDTVPLAFVVKDSWRHKLTHVDNQLVWVDTDFSPQVAEEIVAAARGFMRKLAQDLPE